MFVIDLKADSLELLATLMASAEKVRERRVSIPVKCFSNQAGKATFAFNPMMQSFWSKFDLLTRTDILCGANGLTYGTDYGASYFSSANAAVLFHALKAFPNLNTFQELADAIGTVITTTKKQERHPEIRKAGGAGEAQTFFSTTVKRWSATGKKICGSESCEVLRSPAFTAMTMC